jgi:hypothetical protein
MRYSRNVPFLKELRIDRSDTFEAMVFQEKSPDFLLEMRAAIVQKRERVERDFQSDQDHK